MSLSDILGNATEITSVFLAEISANKIIKYWTPDPTSPSNSYETPYPFDGHAYITNVFYGDSTTPKYIPLTLVSNAGAVASTPGSYYWDRTNLYIQLLSELESTSPGYFTPDPRMVGNTVVVQVTYYFCSHTAKIFNDIYYEPILLQNPALSLRVEQDFSGIGQVAGASTILDNSKGFFDQLTDLNWDGGQTTIKIGADQPTIGIYMDYSGYETIGTWLNDNWTKTNQSFTINNLELKQILTLNLPQRLYSTSLINPATGLPCVNMDSNSVGKPVPLAYGIIFGASPTCIDTVNKIFKLADETLHPIFSIDAVRQATATGWMDLNFGTDYLTDNTNCQLIIPGWDGVSNISIDFHGYTRADGTWNDNAADMVQDILAFIGQTQIDRTSFSASHKALVVGTTTGASNTDNFAVNLPSLGSYVSAPYNSALDAVTGDFTVEAWIWLNSVPGNLNCGFVDRGNLPAFPRIGLICVVGKLAATFNGAAFSLTGGTIPLSQWVHIAVTRTGSTVTLWMNGISSAVGTYGTPISYSGQAINAGCSASSNQNMYGGLSEVRISSLCRYVSNFVPQRVLGSDGLTVLYWRMNDGTGTTALDSSASGITGTLQGAATWETLVPIGEISQLVPSLYLNKAQSAQEVIQEINQIVGSYLFVDANGTYRYVVFLPQPGEGLPLFDATSIINFQKDNPSMVCQSEVSISFSNRLTDGWGQLLTLSNPKTQFSIGQASPVSIGPQVIGLSTLADASYWAQRQLIFLGTKPSIYTISLPWALFLRLPTDQIHVQYPRHTLDAIFEIVEIDTQGNGLDSYQSGSSAAPGSSSGGPSGTGLQAIVSNFHNFNNTVGFVVLPDGFTSGEEGIPSRFANLAGYGTGSLDWNAGWDTAIKSWAFQNVGYATDDNGFICDSTTGLPDPVTQGHSVCF